MQNIARPPRVVATCVETDPWQLTVDDLRLAIRVGKAIQATGKLGDLVVGIIKIVLDAQHLCDAGQLYSSLAVPRIKLKSAIRRSIPGRRTSRAPTSRRASARNGYRSAGRSGN